MSSQPGERLDATGKDFTKQVRHDTYPFIDPTTSSLLHGKRVLVTGASKGIGLATAVSYAKAGASFIAIAARSDLSRAKSEILAAATAAGRTAGEIEILTLKMDVSSQVSVDAAAKQVRATFKHLDIVVSNAGVMEPLAKVADSDPKVWWGTYEINVLGSYLVARAFIPLLLAGPSPGEGGGLRIFVAVGSIGAHIIYPGFTAYQTGKLAVCRLVELLSCEYGADADGGLLALATHPGGVETDISVHSPPDIRKRLLDTPELAGDTTAWLTRERRPWLAGRYVSCQWDMQELLGKRDEIVRADLLKVRLALSA